MDNLYPPGPAPVAQDLTAPGPAYKRQAKVALLSLLLFIALYLSLTGWFAWTAYDYFVNAAAVEQGAWVGYGFAAAAAFLTIFLAKALFFVNRGGEVNDIEVTAEEEPRLFEFLYRLADEAGAPAAPGIPVWPRQRGGVLRPDAPEPDLSVKEEPRNRPGPRQRPQPG